MIPGTTWLGHEQVTLGHSWSLVLSPEAGSPPQTQSRAALNTRPSS